MTCKGKHGLRMFVSKTFLLMLCMQWHLPGCVGAPCYDFFTKEARPCFPQPVNAATGRNVSASNTCGTPSTSYCEISPEKKCFVCNASSSMDMHPAHYMVCIARSKYVNFGRSGYIDEKNKNTAFSLSHSIRIDLKGGLFVARLA